MMQLASKYVFKVQLKMGSLLNSHISCKSSCVLSVRILIDLQVRSQHCDISSRTEEGTVSLNCT